MNKFNSNFCMLLFAFIISSSLVFLFPIKVKADVNMRSTNVTGGAFKRAAYFEKNIGQTNSDVLYLYPSAGYRLMLSSNEAVIAIPTPGLNQPRLHDPASLRKLNRNRGPRKETRLKMNFLGANKSPKISGKEELKGKSNYFIGKDRKAWLRNVPHYDKVVYEDIYPAIDLIFYSNETKLEYDFVVKQGADPGKIRFAFEGIDRLSIDSAGDLVLSFGGEKLRLHAPKMYQMTGGHKAEVNGKYVVHDNIFGFQVAAYDHSAPLVIDPVLSYATFLGGGGYDAGHKIAVDPDKNAYVVGRTDAISPDGTNDVFVVKFDSAGQLVYLSFIGGTWDDTGNGIAVDASGNVYVVGATASYDFPTTPGVIQQSKVTGSADAAFVAKISSSGSDLLYSTYLSGGPQITDEGYIGPASYTGGNGIAVDPAGNAYVTGYTWSPTFPVTPGAYQTTYHGPSDAFIVKLNGNATQLLYSTYLGGSGGDEAHTIAIDADGNAYVAGNTEPRTSISGNDFPVKNALQPVPNGLSADGFVAKLNPTGSDLVFSTYLGGSDGLDGIWGIAVDTLRNIYVTGQTKSADWPGAQNPSPSITTFGDGFVTKLGPTGDTIIYSRYLGGYFFDFGVDIAADAFGNAYVIGMTNSLDFPITQDAYQKIQPGNEEFFIAKLDPIGVILYSTFLGGFTNDIGYGIAIGSPTEIYVTGAATSTDFPMVNAVQPEKGGFFDAVIAKIDLAAPVHQLSIEKKGIDTNNIFTITTNPPGIECGQYCTASHPYDIRGLRCGDYCKHFFDAGAQVKIIVTPDPSKATDWSCTFSGTDTDTITMNQDSDVTVTFTKLYQLNVFVYGNGTVISNPAGIDCKDWSTCSKYYPPGAEVTLTAAPDVHSTFVGWSGEGCSGTGACIVTMNQTRNVYATFTKKQQYTLTVTKPGTGEGTATSSDKLINCGTDCVKNYLPNKEVTLKAIPDKSNSYFAGWGGDCSAAGINPTCTLTMDVDKNVTSIFTAHPTLTVTKTGDGKGRVRSAPMGVDCGVDCTTDSGQFKYQTKVTLKATADQYSTFLGWSGDACSSITKATCSLPMDASKNVTAQFGLPDISVSPTEYNFGNIKIKTQPEPAVFTILNNGIGDLKITKIEITGTDAKMFKVISGSKKPIKPGASLDFSLTFKPTTIGKKAATLRILSNDPDESAASIPLSGGGR